MKSLFLYGLMASQIKKIGSVNVYRLLKDKYLATSYLVTGVSMIEEAYAKVYSHCWSLFSRPVLIS